MSLVFAALALVSPIQETPTENAPAKEERKVCRTTESDTGSRMGPRRVCRTAAEWRAMNSRTDKDMDRHSRQGSGGQ